MIEIRRFIEKDGDRDSFIDKDMDRDKSIDKDGYREICLLTQTGIYS